MPDITMCRGDTCALSDTCYRCPTSGTEPDPVNQSWFIEEPYYRDGTKRPIICDYYWEIRRKKPEVHGE